MCCQRHAQLLTFASFPGSFFVDDWEQGHTDLYYSPVPAGSSPVKLSGLTPGEHLLKVVAVGCRNRMNLKTKILIP